MTKNQDKLLELVNSALKSLYENDIYLIKNKVHERTIVFRFGLYFYRLIIEKGFNGYDLDFEYNKNHSDPKKTKSFPNGTFPDILLHKRGCNDKNLLIIEFKTWWNSNNDKDILKLRDFTHPDGDFKYKLGLSIIINKNTPKIFKIINGEIANE